MQKSTRRLQIGLKLAIFCQAVDFVKVRRSKRWWGLEYDWGQFKGRGTYTGYICCSSSSSISRYLESTAPLRHNSLRWKFGRPQNIQHALKEITANTSWVRTRQGRNSDEKEPLFFQSQVVLPLGKEPVACLQTLEAIFHQEHPAAGLAHELARISPIKSSICTIDRCSAAAAAGENEPRSEKPIAVSRSMETCAGSSCVAAKINRAKQRKRRRTDSFFSPAH